MEASEISPLEIKCLIVESSSGGELNWGDYIYIRDDSMIESS